METETLKVLGQVAGIGGIALGVFMVLFRDLIRGVFQNIFPQLTKQQATEIIKMAMFFIWSLALVGILAWAGIFGGSSSNISQNASGNATAVIQTGNGDVTVGETK